MDPNIINLALLPKDVYNAYVARIRQGHPRCPISVGRRITKIKSKPGDKHKDGDQGTVMGSDFDKITNTPIYYIFFDDMLTGVKWKPNFVLAAESDESENIMVVGVNGDQVREI